MLRVLGQEHDKLDAEVEKLRRTHFGSLGFPATLEAQFEQDTGKDRSHRLWLEGLLALVALNICLLLDLVLVRDAQWQSVVWRTLLITPLALFINSLMRRKLRPWMREGSVAVGATAICFVNIYVQGSSTAAAATFAMMSVLIMVLFTGVVMRIRLAYASAAITAMGLAGLVFLVRAGGLEPSEKVVGSSLLLIGIVITMTAAYSLEREERLNYLLTRRSAAQAEELECVNAELLKMSTLDKLTGLPNRRAFDEHFANLWTLGEQHRTPLSVILIDVDHFKVLNDVFGHLYGDTVLQRIASLLPQALRGYQDVAARFGGEEFTVLLPDTNPDTALLIADRIRNLIETAGTPPTTHFANKLVMWVTVSLGVSTCVPTEKLTMEALLHSADEALYDAKGAGRNRVVQMTLEPVSSSS